MDSRTYDDREVETSQVDGTWEVRFGSTVLARHAGRPEAVGAGFGLAANLGVPHVVRYAAVSARRPVLV